MWNFDALIHAVAWGWCTFIFGIWCYSKGAEDKQKNTGKRVKPVK